MLKIILQLTIFGILSAVIAYIGGYDFDHRGPDVAIYTLTAIILGITTVVGLNI